MKLNKKLLAAVLIGLMTMTGSALAAENVTAKDAGISKGTAMQTEQKLQLEEKWDKVFPKSNKVEHKKVTFHNRYGITLAADMYVPKNSSGKKYPAQLRNSAAVCMPKLWRSADFSLSPSIRPSPAKAAAMCGM